MGLLSLAKRCKSIPIRALSFVILFTCAVSARFLIKSACANPKHRKPKDTKCANPSPSQVTDTEAETQAKSSASPNATSPPVEPKAVAATALNGLGLEKCNEGQDVNVVDIDTVQEKLQRKSSSNEVSLVEDDGKDACDFQERSIDPSSDVKPVLSKNSRPVLDDISHTQENESALGNYNRVTELKEEVGKECHSPLATAGPALDPRTFGITPRDPRYHKPCKEDIPIVPQTRPFEARLESAMKRCAKKERRQSLLKSAIQE